MRPIGAGVAKRQHVERLVGGRFERILDGKVFAEGHVLALEHGHNAAVAALDDFERIRAARYLEIREPQPRQQLQAKREALGGLLLIGVRPQRNREARAQVLDIEPLVVFELDALEAVAGNRHDLGGKRGSASRFFGAVFALAKQAGVDRLRLETLVDLLGATTFEDHARDAHHVIPDSEARNRGLGRQGEHPLAFLHAAAVAGEDLPDRDAGGAVVDPYVDLHLFERQSLDVGLLETGRNQNAGVRSDDTGKNPRG